MSVIGGAICLFFARITLISLFWAIEHSRVMFNLGALASSVLDSIDNVAKESLEDQKASVTSIRSQRRTAASSEALDAVPGSESNPNVS